MDELLPRTMLETMQIFLTLVAIIILVIIVNNYMAIMVLVVAAPVYFMANYYRNTIQGIKRLEGAG